MLSSRLLNASTATKLYGIFLSLMLLFVAAVFLVFLPFYEEQLLQNRRESLTDIVDVGYTLVSEYQVRVDKGEFSLEEAQKRAAQRLRNMRYGNNEYFWINDMGTPAPTMVMHPTVPALEGKQLSDAKFDKAERYWLGDAGNAEAKAYPGGNKNLFSAFVEVCQQSGAGFVAYVWPKPKKEGGATTEVYPKISFVKLYKPWGWVIGTGLYVDDIQAQVAGIRKVLAAALVVVLGLAGGLVFFVVRVITRPMRRLTVLATAISQGDLEAREAERFHSEMGVLQQAMEAMVETLRAKIGEVERSVRLAQDEAQVAQKAVREAEEAKQQAALATRQGLLEAAGRLRGVSRAIDDVSRDISSRIESSRRGADLQRDRLGATTSSMESLNGTVLTVARSAGEAAEAADKARERAQAGAEVVGRVVGAIQSVSTQAQTLKENMGQLGRQADGIGQVMGVINDIADQTNLLALNAAIEAARAGDAGRGFAVVADEVRKLAEKTMTATREVAEAIGGIQKGTRENVRSVDLAVEGIEEATELAKQSGQALSGIVDLVQVSSRQVSAIAGASGEQSAASDEINTSLEEVSRVASETAQAMNEAVEAVAGLVEQARTLLALVGELEQA